MVRLPVHTDYLKRRLEAGAQLEWKHSLCDDKWRKLAEGETPQWDCERYEYRVAPDIRSFRLYKYFSHESGRMEIDICHDSCEEYGLCILPKFGWISERKEVQLNPEATSL